MDARDRAFLEDFIAFGSLNHLVTAVALFCGGADGDRIAGQVHELLERVDAEEARREAEALNTAARVQSVVVARLVGELAAALEDCGGMAVAVRNRANGVLNAYLRSSVGQVTRLLAQVAAAPPHAVPTLLGLPDLDDCGEARPELTPIYAAVDEYLRNVAAAYVAVGEATPSQPGAGGTDVPPDMVTILLAVDEEASRVQAGLLATAHARLRHRFAVVEDLGPLSTPEHPVRFAHYPRNAAAVRALLPRIASVTSTTQGLAKLLLRLDPLGLA